jgi:acyl-coenzyme A thioesterase PaaI-like protein
VNGGMAIGMLVCPVLHAAARDGFAHATVARVTARIRAGVPVDGDLAVEAYASDGGYAVTVRHGDGDIMSGTAELRPLVAPRAPDDVIASPPEDRADLVARLAVVPVPDAPPFFVETGDHPIPGCFSCGPEHPDGLHIYPRVVEDGLTCASWQADGAFDNGDGTISEAVIASAIDCSSGICLPIQDQRDLIENDQFFLLGTMDVRYLRAAPATGAYRVAARSLRRDGRKFYGLSVLADEDGTPYAMAEATWIVAGISRSEAFGQ